MYDIRIGICEFYEHLILLLIGIIANYLLVICDRCQGNDHKLPLLTAAARAHALKYLFLPYRPPISLSGAIKRNLESIRFLWFTTHYRRCSGNCLSFPTCFSVDPTI